MFDYLISLMNHLLMGSRFQGERLVCKVLRSLLDKFDMKVITIEEAQDILFLKVDELFGSLLTFDMSLEGKLEKKN